MEKYYMQIYHHILSTSEDDAWVDLKNLEIHPEMAQLLAEFGILEIQEGQIRLKHAARLAKLQRLRCGLGVNLNGAAIILDLLERIEAMQEEIDRLKRGQSP
ncbi:MAG: chaperone modulator CbpM [Desulfotomaculaceae bacterium]|nr:chaperone modulator CbpM [Desulfotomaculaceae bacterium]MDD4767656.1 chaperone modulator CbpM [Desulfotomaculaceae bacterium]